MKIFPIASLAFTLSSGPILAQAELPGTKSDKGFDTFVSKLNLEKAGGIYNFPHPDVNSSA